ncbi:glycosyltransferase [Bradyrhizobium sp. BWA-3-5]|uniref:CgeB family protein n=1 Tax=Bradyrhizobium sp. BWA-3-5 TaxID=3080013 RepID=UPI00293F5AA0|nr:glycosyltransferase [Bradyrhizobium sp. BWA-3-5]WOH69128.1 glycosyltransferase [Bradyrhizobium sp. BWA-3-5]
MKFVFFCHALTSCWNNGNAHFLRGIARELRALGHDVTVYEPDNGWSRLNAIRDGGIGSLQQAQALLPGIDIRQYETAPDLDQALDVADVVIVHEWNAPDLIGDIGRRRIEGAPFTLLFHDTHHRAVTAPEQLDRFDLQGFDGVLAFGEVLRQIYLRLGWANRAFTWHEAADTELYRPHCEIEPTHDVIWIGNWGDNERSAELNEFLLRPVAELGLRARIHGVRYSLDALRAIEAAGIEYCGWLPAHQAPIAFASARFTVHVPRGPYARSLPGIPTIRMFEAMACGIPIVSAPWDDAELLFPSGSYLRAADGTQMKEAMRTLLEDQALAADLVKTGLEAIQNRHTCRHRAAELIEIVSSVRGARRAPPTAQFEEAMP